MSEKKKPTQQDINRVILGNQVIIMRSLSTMMQNMVGDMEKTQMLDLRVRDSKVWWRSHFDEELGFSTYLGDEPVL